MQKCREVYKRDEGLIFILIVIKLFSNEQSVEESH